MGSPTPSVFGGYCSAGATTSGENFGDESSFIFSLLPVCRVYHHRATQSQRGMASRNFATLNSDSSRGPVGFSMGGRLPHQSRLWIGNDMRHASFARSGDDQTYVNGPLASTGSIQFGAEHVLLGIEVWSFGNEERRTEWNKSVSK